MYCRTCMHWRRPPAAVNAYGKVAEGICRIDSRQSHPTYTCVDHEDFASTEGRLGLTNIEVLWLRANQDHVPDARGLIRLYNMVIASPYDPGARGLFAAALNDWRRNRPHGVLATHSKRMGAATGNQAGATEESTHAHRFARQPSDP